jgi:hypothetical protein
MTLDSPDEDVARIVFTETLKMRVEAVTIHLHVEAAFLTLGTDLHHSALDLRSRWKNRVVRDQSFPLLIYECLSLFLHECLSRFFINIPCVQGLEKAGSPSVPIAATQYSDYRRRGWGWIDHQYV